MPPRGASRALRRSPEHSSTWCLKVRLVFQTVRHREVARKAREGRPTYCPSAHPEGGTEGTGYTGRSSSRKRPVCRSVAERVEGTLTMGDQHVPRRGYLAASRIPPKEADQMTAPPPRGSRGQIPSDTLEEDGSQSRTIIVLRPLKLSSSPQRGRINGQRSPTGESRPQECLQREELVCEEVRVISHSLSAVTLTTR